MTDDYKDFGENPGIALTTCTGCGEPRRYYGARKGTHCQNCGKPWAEAEAAALFPVQQPGVTAATNGVPFSKPPRIAPDECVIPRELAYELLSILTTRSFGAYPPMWLCLACNKRAILMSDIEHGAECAAQRLDAALADASGDDGGTPNGP